MAGTSANEQGKPDTNIWQRMQNWAKAHTWVSTFLSILLLLLLAAVIAVGLAVIFWALGPNDAPPWTGFGDTKHPLYSGISPYKNLWDWLGLLIIPIFLAIGAAVLGRAQQNREFRAAELDRKLAAEAQKNQWEIEKVRQEENLLETYYARMTEFMLEYNLRSSSIDDEVRTIARATTLAVLRGLNGERKGQVVKFLQEAHLINTPQPIVNLSGADLRAAVLESAVLRKAHLAGTDMREAKLTHADLDGADISGANLIHAELRKSRLKRAILAGAYLSGARLREAVLESAVLNSALLNNAGLIASDLREADLTAANLVGADLSRAVLQGANLDQVKYRPSKSDAHTEDSNAMIISEATYNAATTWPSDYDPAGQGAVLLQE